MKGIVVIKTSQPWPVDKLYAQMQEKGNFSTPYTFKGKLLKRIEMEIEGDRHAIILIQSDKKKIQLEVDKATTAANIGTSVLTDGWSDVFDSNRKRYDSLVQEVAQEIRRIIGE